MTLNSSIHRSILLSILKDIYFDASLSSMLGFKGGTAAYLFYELPRFSVDLDFDLLQPAQEDFVFARVKQILEKYGLVKTAQKKRFNLLFILSYKGKKEGSQNIKIEINRRDFGSSYETKSHLGVPMLVMVKEDIVAHKLCAFYERLGEANRDIFDVQFFLTQDWTIHTELVEKRMGRIFSTFLQDCIVKLEKLGDYDFLFGLGELVTEKQKEWIRTRLKEETLFALRLLLSNQP